MLVLLPPSESKNVPPAGTRLSLPELSFPELTAARSEVIADLEQVSARADAHKVLKAPAAAQSLIDGNLRLRTAPAGPAAAIYSGVLFDAAGIDVSDPHADRILVFSALWGPLSIADVIAPYRLSAGTTLPNCGRIESYWRTLLMREMAGLGDGELVIDCRSAGYANMWTPPDPARHVGIRVERQVGDRRAVVSHHAKYLRGMLAGALAREAASPATAQDLADAARDLTRPPFRTTTGESIVDIEVRRGPKSTTLTFVALPDEERR
ncbi:YaaA family protein [Rarobacter incanus]|uniref:YaaA family protein n=1 Tax=Rarobacter incanus TaxID=153494 RepID=UPI0014769D30|nr:peroxide stress protein YaaA [Rarobacter incanus]